jgi:hypothetical protein
MADDKFSIENRQMIQFEEPPETEEPFDGKSLIRFVILLSAICFWPNPGAEILWTKTPGRFSAPL